MQILPAPGIEAAGETVKLPLSMGAVLNSRFSPRFMVGIQQYTYMYILKSPLKSRACPFRQ